MSYTLVVVDMQPYFSATRKCFLSVIEEVKKAIKDNAFICVLEFNPDLLMTDKCFSDVYTISLITDELKGYKNKNVVTKDHDDGTAVIVPNVPYQNKRHFKVCGVNLNACVISTVEGLDAYYNKGQSEDVLIEILYNACASDSTCVPTKKGLIKRCTYNVKVV